MGVGAAFVMPCDPVDPELGLPGFRARSGDRSMVRSGRGGNRPRTDARRGAPLALLLGKRLSRQHPTRCASLSSECRGVVPESRAAKSTRLDLGGTVLAAGGLVALVDAIIEAPTRGWTGGMTIAEAAVGLALLGWFVVFELRSPTPAHRPADLQRAGIRCICARGDGHLLLVVREPLRSHSVPYSSFTGTARSARASARCPLR